MHAMVEHVFKAYIVLLFECLDYLCVALLVKKISDYNGGDEFLKKPEIEELLMMEFRHADWNDRPEKSEAHLPEESEGYLHQDNEAYLSAESRA
jgi:hypothetical protein